MISEEQGFLMSLSGVRQIGLDKSLLWRVLCESKAKKGKV